MKETHFDGHRSGRNFSLDRQTEPLVLDSEISGLENLHAYLKHGNYVARFSFPVLEVAPSKPKFIERLEDDYIVREPRGRQTKTPTHQEIAEPPTRESTHISSEQGRQRAMPIPADVAQEKHQADLSFGPRI
jgi:hypothetical protein